MNREETDWNTVIPTFLFSKDLTECSNEEVISKNNKSYYSNIDHALSKSNKIKICEQTGDIRRWEI